MTEIVTVRGKSKQKMLIDGMKKDEKTNEENMNNWDKQRNRNLMNIRHKLYH